MYDPQTFLVAFGKVLNGKLRFKCFVLFGDRVATFGNIAPVHKALDFAIFHLVPGLTIGSLCFGKDFHNGAPHQTAGLGIACPNPGTNLQGIGIGHHAIAGLRRLHTSCNRDQGTKQCQKQDPHRYSIL